MANNRSYKYLMYKEPTEDENYKAWKWLSIRPTTPLFVFAADQQ